MEYSPPIQNVTYLSNGSIYTSGAMESTVFKLSRVFLDSALPDRILPEDILQAILDNPDNAGNIFWDDTNGLKTDVVIEVVQNSYGFFAALIFGLIMTCCMWLIGLIWCCGRCCCKCGEGKRSSAGDGFSLVIQSLIMAGLVFCCTLSMAWYFGASNFAASGLEAMPDNFDSIVHDIDAFITNTVQELEHVSVQNFDELNDIIEGDIEQTGNDISLLIANISTDVQLQTMMDISDFFNTTAFDFAKDKKGEFKEILANMNGQVSNMSSLISDFKVLLNNSGLCSPPTNLTCDFEFDASQLPDPNLMDTIDIPEATLESISDLNSALQEADDKLDNFSEEFVNDQAQEIRNAIDDISRDVQESVDEVSKTVNGLVIADTQAYRDIKDYISDAQEYFDYVYYIFLAFGVFLVFILVFYAVGLMLGACGSVGGPAKKFGGCCMCTGTVIFFLVSSILWLIATVFFLGGAMSDHLICKTLADPSTSEIGSVLDVYFNDAFNEAIDRNSTWKVNLTFSYVLEQCGQDLSAYEVFQLNVLFDVNEELGEWQDKFDIQGVIDELKESVNTAIDEVVIQADIPTIAKESVEEMAKQFDALQTTIFSSIDGLNLDSFFNYSIIDTIRQELVSAPPETLVQLGAIDAAIVQFNSTFESAKINFKDYSDKLNFGGASISDNLNTALDLSSAAILSLRPGGDSRAKIDSLIDATVDRFINTTDDFVHYVIGFVENDLAKCGPVSGVFDLIENTICYRAVQPFNGLWTGLGLYLILMIPVLIFSCTLETLFRRFREPAYSKEQHIELTSMAGNVHHNPQVIYVQSEPRYQIPEGYRGAKNRQ